MRLHPGRASWGCAEGEHRAASPSSERGVKLMSIFLILAMGDVTPRAKRVNISIATPRHSNHDEVLSNQAESIPSLTPSTIASSRASSPSKQSVSTSSWSASPNKRKRTDDARFITPAIEIVNK